MFKKTRKKSPKPAAGKAARADSPTSARKRASKKRKVTASKSGKKVAKQTAAAARGASHSAPSKQLKKKAETPATNKPVVTEGAKAPDFHLPRDGGGMVSLSDFAGKKLVLFFYPRADTPGCTREAIDFTRLSGAFAESQTAILGVSADPPKVQEAFRDKHQLKTALVSDEQHQMLEAYGVWAEKSMYGKTFLGIVRATVLIGTDGRIIRIWRHVKVDGHADEVLSVVRML